MRRRATKRKRGSSKRKRIYRRPSRRFKRGVKKAVQAIAERKFVDSEAFGSSVSAPSISICPYPANQGVGESAFVGNAIYRRSLMLHTHAIASTDTPGNAIRMVVFMWTPLTTGNVTGNLPTYSDLVQNTNPVFYMTTPLNRANLQLKRIIPMYDRVFYLSSTSGPAFWNRTLKFYGKRLPHKKMYFEIPTGSQIDHRYSIWIAAWSDSAAIAHPTLTVWARLSYNDM